MFNVPNFSLDRLFFIESSVQRSIAEMQNPLVIPKIW